MVCSDMKLVLYSQACQLDCAACVYSLYNDKVVTYTQTVFGAAFSIVCDFINHLVFSVYLVSKSSSNSVNYSES